MTPDILIVIAILITAAFLIVFEIVRIDIAAFLVMITLTWTGVVTPGEAFSGLSSNAVIAVIAVMILGYGLEKSGLVKRLSLHIVRKAGNNPNRLVGLISTSVGILSGFMQNIGAAALFLPAMVRIARTTGVSLSRMLIPVGFAAILGGTVTMVGSGPLIILNDLLTQRGFDSYSLFDVTPIGLSVLISGILLFKITGDRILPDRPQKDDASRLQEELIESWQLPRNVSVFKIGDQSALIGKTREEIRLCEIYSIHLIALFDDHMLTNAPSRHIQFHKGQIIALLGGEESIERFRAGFDLEPVDAPGEMGEFSNSLESGFAEVLVPPRSPFIGRTIRQIGLRQRYNVEPVIMIRSGEEIGGDFSDKPLAVGDGLILHGRWEHIIGTGDRRHFVLVTPVEETSTTNSSPLMAAICFGGALTCAFAGAPIAVSLITGAVAMIVSGVVDIDEAYAAIDWRTVFLLAGLIPLGIAMERSGAAEYIANILLSGSGASSPLHLMFGIAVLTTIFSLFMSNVAATVLLVPIVMLIADHAGVNPRAMALLVGISASNSFMLPTHQVNALFMSPGGYRNRDYIVSGGIMSILFIIIVVLFIHFFYL